MPRDFYVQTSAKKRETSPAWRGVGCILMFLLPVVTFGLTYIFSPLVAATGLMPFQVLGHVKFPDWMYRVRVISNIANFIGGINNLWLDVIVFIVILVLLLGIFSLLYTVTMQVIGPPRYTEVDAAPTKYKAKKYTR